MTKKKVLFVCVHNSARSQMAEAFLKHLAGDRFEVYSAGLEPGKLNPLAVQVMMEKGFDLSKNKTKSVFDFYNRGDVFSYVITVCDEASAESCPLFPGSGKRMHWSLEDPSTFTGTAEERLEKVRKVRDEIQEKVMKFIQVSMKKNWE